MPSVPLPHNTTSTTTTNQAQSQALTGTMRVAHNHYNTEPGCHPYSVFHAFCLVVQALGQSFHMGLAPELLDDECSVIP